MSRSVTTSTINPATSPFSRSITNRQDTMSISAGITRTSENTPSEELDKEYHHGKACFYQTKRDAEHACALNDKLLLDEYWQPVHSVVLCLLLWTWAGFVVRYRVSDVYKMSIKWLQY
ncbi:uncharacterized protein BCR38DRAFT_411632 [Pseudomassariella vexata]|uniref:Uncharacterized protein n=1 Tax=Pseudomassariella vexata TaxID=1141098 RepID=A0A1Y2DR99_9PEZI|nr:uncharacterized protein BCR38DRAFT_411632 [Pseudomassariella vexata]ORY61790.1 hypothetical protein BCR38DRAFT_411632 [Pseudomassariella vexata]